MSIAAASARPRPTTRMAVIGLVVAALLATRPGTPQEIVGSDTYRPEIVGRVGVVGAGRHFAAEAGMRMLARGGNAIDAGVAATFAAAVTEISHFGLGGEVPIIVHLAGGKVVVVSGQGTAPAAATAERFRQEGGTIPGSGPSAGTVPAVVDALAITLAEFGTRSLAETLEPAIALADGFVWYDFLAHYMQLELTRILSQPSGARVYLQGPGGGVPAVGSVFRQPQLAATLRALAEEEGRSLDRGRKAAIYAARDRFHAGDIGQRIAAAVAQAGGLLSAADLASYHGRVEPPASVTFTTSSGAYAVFKTGFWGQGPVLLQALAILQGIELRGMGHNSADYIHTVTEALKLALADRDEFYGDPDFAKVPAAGLLSAAYAAERRGLIDPVQASLVRRPGDPWKFEPSSSGAGARAVPATPGATPPAEGAAASSPGRGSPDTTTVNVVDAQGNLFSAAPSSAWFFGGVFVAGDTGVPLGNRMQAFVLDRDHPNELKPGKRPRTTLSPTVVLRDGRPFAALSSPGGDSQDQQALQVLLNLAVFGMRPQAAIEAPRFNTLHLRDSFRRQQFRPGELVVEQRIGHDVIAELRGRGHRVSVVGPFMMDTGTVLVGVDPRHGTLVGAADVRRQRFVTGW